MIVRFILCLGFLVTSSLACFSALAQVNLDPFYANAVVQLANPRAYALTKPAIRFHAASKHTQEKERVVAQLRLNRALAKQIKTFETLSYDKQVKTLEAVFKALVRAMGIPAPTLLLEKGPQERIAYFDFDPALGGTGTIYIDPGHLLADPYETLILLIHETRHSAQFQLSQTQIPNALAKGYKEAFRVQHQIFESGTRISFCDFSSLLNEHEAFEFANYVVNRLTGGKVNRIEMGTMASQFNEKGEPHLDVLQLLQTTRSDEETFQTFNDLMKLFRPIR